MSVPDLSALECRLVGPQNEAALSRFFAILQESGTANFFHPHPFSEEEAHRRAAYEGRDFYYVLVADNEILAYGMLRGWDEGYAVPSLGIAVHPQHRGAGLGRLLMHFLHTAARFRGAPRVRLKVYADNVAAVKLYESLGYVFAEQQEGQLVGILELSGS